MFKLDPAYQQVARFRGVGHCRNMFELEACLIEQMTPEELQRHKFKSVICNVLVGLTIFLSLLWIGKTGAGGSLFLAMCMLMFPAALVWPLVRPYPAVDALREFREMQREETAKINAEKRAERIRQREQARAEWNWYEEGEQV